MSFRTDLTFCIPIQSVCIVCAEFSDVKCAGPMPISSSGVKAMARGP